MHARTFVKIATGFTVASVCGLAWVQASVPTSQASNHLNLAYAKSMSFGIDPHWSGDQGEDSFYDLNNFICTDGIAIQLANQTPGNGGHSLVLTNVQDYTGAAKVKDASGNDLGLDPNLASVPMADGLPNAFAQSTNGDNFTKTDYVFPYGIDANGVKVTKDVGREVVATIRRLDHGDTSNPYGVFAEEQVPSGGFDANNNGDDAIVPVPANSSHPSYIPTDQGDYNSWTTTDDHTTDHPNGPGSIDGDAADNTDGSSFDDVVRTDQVPAASTTDMFTAAPNPANSTVQDCVVNKQPPVTEIDFNGGSNVVWYTSPPTVTLTAHKAYYNGGPVTTYFNLDGTGYQTYSSSTPIVPGFGTHTIQFYSADSSGDSEAPQSATFHVDQFKGFFQPVDNPTVVNTAKAGSAIPVKFSLTGNQGLSIFAAGFPNSTPMSCSTLSTDSTSPIDQTVTAGSSSLSYDASSDTYSYVWKTSSSWSGTCRLLTVQLNDGTSHTAYFKFK